MLSNGLLNRAGEAAAAGGDPTTAAAPPHLNGPVSPSRDMSPEMRKARVQNSMRILKDEPVPEGYLRFRFNEDCHYTHCGYREHQTHFHCMRQDCGYSFCDKTRFVQHTARHERYVLWRSHRAVRLAVYNDIDICFSICCSTDWTR